MAARTRLPTKRHLVLLLLSFPFVFHLLIYTFRYVVNCDEEEGFRQRPPRTNDNESLVPFHPFEKDQPRMVIILTYQRCGSTFFGELFNENPNAFYLFEPLDSLYSSIYGTKQGWNVPSDITNYANGTARQLPEAEIEHVSRFLQTLLSCDVDSLPTETLAHRFYGQFQEEFLSIGQYVRCIKRYKVRMMRCTGLNPSSYCGFRFGEASEEVLEDCRKAMTDEEYRRKHENRTLFDNYFECMKELRERVNDKCVPILRSGCVKRSLRAVKLVRGTMDSMEPLLRSIPNVRVIHLVRDPRAVVLSRKRFDSSARGRYANMNENETLSREALLYCSTAVRDILKRKELEKKYPGKIFPVIYDDVVTRLQSYAEDVYSFLGLPVPHSVWDWYRERFQRQRVDSAAVARKWEAVLTYRENRDITAVCEEFFQLTQFEWVK